jgi:hypothetical protein
MNHPGDISQWVQKAEEDYHSAVTLVRKRKHQVPDNGGGIVEGQS